MLSLRVSRGEDSGGVVTCRAPRTTTRTPLCRHPGPRYRAHPLAPTLATAHPHIIPQPMCHLHVGLAMRLLRTRGLSSPYACSMLLFKRNERC